MTKKFFEDVKVRMVMKIYNLSQQEAKKKVMLDTRVHVSCEDPLLDMVEFDEDLFD